MARAKAKAEAEANAVPEVMKISRCVNIFCFHLVLLSVYLIAPPTMVTKLFSTRSTVVCSAKIKDLGSLSARPLGGLKPTKASGGADDIAALIAAQKKAVRVQMQPRESCDNTPTIEYFVSLSSCIEVSHTLYHHKQVNGEESDEELNFETDEDEDSHDSMELNMNFRDSVDEQRAKAVGSMNGCVVLCDCENEHAACTLSG